VKIVLWHVRSCRSLDFTEYKVERHRCVQVDVE